LIDVIIWVALLSGLAQCVYCIDRFSETKSGPGSGDLKDYCNYSWH